MTDAQTAGPAAQDDLGAGPSAQDTRPVCSRAAMVRGVTLAVPALVALDGGIASWAQWTARQEFPPSTGAPPQYSLDRHVLAMVLLSTLTVAIASMLAHLHQRGLGIAVLAGVATGPMCVLAAPVTAAVVSTEFNDTRWWWHAVVQGAQFVVMLVWAWWAARLLPGLLPPTAVPADDGAALPHGRISSAALFSLYAAVTLTAQILSRTANGIESAGLLTMAGWAVLGAGAAVVVTQLTWRPITAVTTIGAIMALGSMYVAYVRPGGWPGVAGWENGIQAPVVLSLATSMSVLAGPLIGVVLRYRHNQAPAPQS